MGLLFRHRSSLEHLTGPHPESADRLVALDTVLSELDWLGMEVHEAPAARVDQIERVHSPRMIERVRELCGRGGGMIDADTVTSAGSYEAGLRVAGGAVAGVDAILAGETNWAFSMLRPPGHHAEHDRSMGFCLFNGIAVGAAHAIASGLERVLILDWDVHHGNGTEDIFSASDEVLFASIHQSPLYPGTGPASYIGDGPGEGYTVNLPVPPGSGSAEFCALVEHVVAPLALAFEPELICVSAGFDAHRADPLANCEVDEAGFEQMTLAVREVAMELGIGVLACLEGGYDIRALVSSTRTMIEAFEHGGELASVDPAPAEAHRRRVAERWSI